MKPGRFSYTRVEAGQTLASELAYLPLVLHTTAGSIEVQGPLDTGSTVNVLPYTDRTPVSCAEVATITQLCLPGGILSPVW